MVKQNAASAMLPPVHALIFSMPLIGGQMQRLSLPLGDK